MIRFAVVCIIIGLVCGCSKSGSPSKGNTDTTTTTPPKKTDTAFSGGADVSWVTQMESQGIFFYNTQGAQQDLFAILKGLGMNAIRLRVWVNPPGGWCGTADLLAKARRATAAGMRVMIDFHYSDTWADPGHQTKPAAWANLTTAALVDTLGSYTQHVLDTLKSAGIIPTWVQVGNEVSNGMLWPDGEASLNMNNFAAMVTSGYNAVKAVFPNCKVVVHLANGYDNTTFRWLFDGLKAGGASWDVIGMSLYPSTTDYQTLDSQCLANMQDMTSRYGKEVMVCEVGMEEDAASTTEAFLKDIIGKTQSVTGGLGVFYWEPECYNNFQGYGLGAFGGNGEPTVALGAFQQ